MNTPATSTHNADQYPARVAVLGAGMMGGAILTGALKHGLSSSDAVVTVMLPHERERWQGAGVQIAHSNAEAVRDADLVLLAVKPHVVSQVLAEIAPALPASAVVVSIAAGVTLGSLQAELPANTALVRVMPNTPATIGEAITAIAPGPQVDDQQLALVTGLFEAVGTTVVVSERDLDAVTAVSGSGPAYVYALAEAMIDGGVLLGLTRPVATALALATIRGAGGMLVESGLHPTVLREQVVSPGGTTAAALAEFSRGGLHATILDGMVACAERSGQLGR